MRILRLLAVIAAPFILGGCETVLMSPAGDVALQQRDVMLISTALMLIIVIPVLALTVYFAWRYRASSTAKYDPDWHHSLPLEVVIWAGPLLIIIVIGAVTWMSTHLLDPFRPLGRISAEHQIASNQTGAAAALPEPLVIQAVALDWKWLFLYPEQGIASLNEVRAPVDRPVEFRITASSVMNALFIPALAGQIYAMPGMETKLHAVINHPGDYEGFSANFSGQGFTDMKFKFHGVDQSDFDAWVREASSNGGRLGREEYFDLEQPSAREPVRLFGDVDPELYGAILNLCVHPGTMCLSEMMQIDANGGGGLEGVASAAQLKYDKRARHSEMPMPQLPTPINAQGASDARPDVVK